MSEFSPRYLARELSQIVEDLERRGGVERTIHALPDTDNTHRLRRLLENLWPDEATRKQQQLNGLQALTRVMDSSERGYWLWDLRSNELQTSAAWATAMQLKSRDQCGLEGWLKRMPEGQVERFMAAINLHLDGFSTEIHIDIRIRNANDEYRWVRCTAKAEHDSYGEPLVIAGTVRDITSERNMLAHSGFLNEHGCIEAIDDLIELGRDVLLIIVDARCNRCAPSTLDPALRRLFRNELLQRMTDVLPPKARISELPGDLLGIFSDCENGPQSELQTLAGKLLRSVRGVGKPLLSDFMIDATLGGAVSKDGETSGEMLISEAMASLREANQQLPSARRSLHDQVTTRAGSTSATVALIRQALSEGTLTPSFQPIIRLTDRKLTGYEALVRIAHREHGTITPAEFLPTAELSDQIIEIGEVVLQRTLASLLSAQSSCDLHAEATISVNISARQLRDERLPVVIGNALARSGIAASRLRLELTETTMVTNLDFARRMLERLRATGVRIALDDFGAGFSSLTYLHELPVDLIKIDRRFVTGADRHAARMAILEAIVGLGSALGIPLIAEGVETEADLLMLKRLNVEFGQGYFLGRPEPKMIGIRGRQQLSSIDVQ